MKHHFHPLLNCYHRNQYFQTVTIEEKTFLSSLQALTHFTCYQKSHFRLLSIETRTSFLFSNQAVAHLLPQKQKQGVTACKVLWTVDNLLPYVSVLNSIQKKKINSGAAEISAEGVRFQANMCRTSMISIWKCYFLRKLLFRFQDFN